MALDPLTDAPSAPSTTDAAARAFEAAPNAMVLTDLSGRVVIANRAYGELVGRSPVDIVGEGSVGWIHPDDVGRVASDVLDLLEGRRAVARNHRRHLRPDGSMVRLAATVTLVPGTGERVNDATLLLTVLEGIELRRRAEDRIAFDRSSAIQHALQEGAVLHDRDGRIMGMSAATEPCIGWPVSELVGRRWTDPLLRAIGADGRPMALADDPVVRCLSGVVDERELTRTVGIHRSDGALQWVSIKARPLPDGGAVSSLRDVTDLVAAEDERGRLAAIVHSSSDFIATWDEEGCIGYLNPAARETFGGAACAHLSGLVSGGHLEKVRTEVADALAADGRWTGALDLRTADGRVIPTITTMFVDGGEGGRALRYSAIAHDLSAQVALEAELTHRASHDGLTGLANRWLLAVHVDELLEPALPDAAVLFVDLDGFKAVNDRLGHGAGDLLLVAVAHQLERVMPPEAIVARVGGDEFVVAVGPLHRLGLTPDLLAQAAVAALRAAGTEGSVGVARAKPGETTASLLDRADEAMYEDKARHRLVG